MTQFFPSRPQNLKLLRSHVFLSKKNFVLLNFPLKTYCKTRKTLEKPSKRHFQLTEALSCLKTVTEEMRNGIFMVS